MALTNAARRKWFRLGGGVMLQLKSATNAAELSSTSIYIYLL
jgi:hypothetical protein